MRLINTAILFMILGSCSPQATEVSIPASTEGGWKLTTTSAVEPARNPDWLGRLGLTRARSASYSGSIDVRADIYELRSEAAALECTQLWKPSPGETRFIKRNLFVVIRSPHPNREMLMDFSRALEKKL